MKHTVSEYDFERAFVDANRSNNFSYEGKKALFEYLEQYGEDVGEEVELDVIALCCDYNEYKNLAEFHTEYDKETYPDIETLKDHTQVIEIKDSESFIIQCF